MARAGAPGDVVVFGFQAPYWVIVASMVFSVLMPFTRARGIVARPGRIQIWRLDVNGFDPIRRLGQVEAPEIILEKKSESFSESLFNITDTIIDRCLDEKLCEHTLELLAFAW